MISHIAGKVTAKEKAAITLDVAGVGFLIFATQQSVEKVKEGDLVTLYTHLVVRDDRFELYGFMHTAEKHFFELLIKVGDVGPKTALAILSLGDLADIQNAIIHGDVAVLTSIPGVGKKTAERIILELKEKVFATIDEGRTAKMPGGAEGVIGALQNLGYSSREAKEAVHEMPNDLASDDDRLRWVLKNIGKQQR